MEGITESKNDQDDLPSLTRDGDTTTDDFVHGTRLVALAASLMLGMFLVALDNVRSCDRFVEILSKRLIILTLDYHRYCNPKDH
jgi:hypothetical protein